MVVVVMMLTLMLDAGLTPTGNYTFVLSADDQAQVWVARSPSQPGG